MGLYAWMKRLHRAITPLFNAKILMLLSRVIAIKYDNQDNDLPKYTRITTSRNIRRFLRFIFVI